MENYSVREQIAFALGYSFLLSMFKKSKSNNFDDVHKYCNELAERFIKEKSIVYCDYSVYCSLKEWCYENIVNFDYEYNNQLINRYVNNNDIKIIDRGYKNAIPVALIECNKNNSKKYLIIFDYELKDKKLSWNYEQIYDNLESSQKQWKKVSKNLNVIDRKAIMNERNY